MSNWHVMVVLLSETSPHIIICLPSSKSFALCSVLMSRGFLFHLFHSHKLFFVHPFSFCTSFTFDIVFFTQFGKSLGLLTVRRDIRIDHGGVGDGQSGLRFRLFNRHGLPGLGSPRYESMVVWLWRICAWRGFGV